MSVNHHSEEHGTAHRVLHIVCGSEPYVRIRIGLTYLCSSTTTSDLHHGKLDHKPTRKSNMMFNKQIRSLHQMVMHGDNLRHRPEGAIRIIALWLCHSFIIWSETTLHPYHHHPPIASNSRISHGASHCDLENYQSFFTRLWSDVLD